MLSRKIFHGGHARRIASRRKKGFHRAFQRIAALRARRKGLQESRPENQPRSHRSREKSKNILLPGAQSRFPPDSAVWDSVAAIPENSEITCKTAGRIA
jgi:hypothetical protein